MKSPGATDGDPRTDRPESSADQPTTEPDENRHELPADTAAELLRRLLAQKSQPDTTATAGGLRTPPALITPPTPKAPQRRRIAIRLRWRRTRQRFRLWVRSRTAWRFAVTMFVIASAIAIWRQYQSEHPPSLTELLPTPVHHLTCVAVGGDGRWIAMGGGSGEVMLWDRQRGQFAPIKSSSRLPISAVRLTTDQFLIAGGMGKRLQVWSLRDFAARDVPLFSAPITCFAAHPRRPEIVVGLQNGKLAVLNSVSGAIAEIDAGHLGWPKVVEFHPAGSWFVTGGADGKLILRDSKSRKTIKAWNGQAADVSALSISSDGRKMASADWSGNVKIWNMTDGELLHELPHPDGVSSVILHGPRLLTASWDGTIRVWSVEDGRESGRVATGQPIIAMALATNGLRAATVSPSNAIRFWLLP